MPGFGKCEVKRLSFCQFIDGIGIDIKQLLNVFKGDIFVFLMDSGRLVRKLRAETCPVFESARIGSAADSERSIRFPRVLMIHFLQGSYEKSVLIVEQRCLAV